MKTEYISWSPIIGYREEELEHAAEVLRRGGLVAFPTETVYGLGGNGLQKEAAARIYAAKGRPSDNPLILHISAREELDNIVQSIPEAAEKLMEKFWPGPMTLIFDKAGHVPYETTGGLETVAVRMPCHEAARQLIAAASVPVAAPSANISGRPSPTKAEHVREDMDGKIDILIDGGAVGIGLESTIVDMTVNPPTVLRPGDITIEQLAAVIGEVRMDPGLMLSGNTVRPKAPGMKYRHYAPKGVMTIYEGEQKAVMTAICREAARYPAEKVGILASEETASGYSHGRVVVAGARKKHTVGRGLYDALRTFDHLGVEVILSESFSGEEKSEAVMNRLVKAAGNNVVYVPGK